MGKEIVRAFDVLWFAFLGCAGLVGLFLALFQIPVRPERVCGLLALAGFVGAVQALRLFAAGYKS